MLHRPAVAAMLLRHKGNIFIFNIANFDCKICQKESQKACSINSRRVVDRFLGQE